MVRLLLRLMGIKDFEVCASCETLRQQLAIANARADEAIETIINLAKPRVVQTTELKSVIPASGLFSRRKAALEARDAAEAKAMNSGFKAAGNHDVVKVTPERVAELERELGIADAG